MRTRKPYRQAWSLMGRDHPVLLGVFALITSALTVCSILAALVQARLYLRIAEERETA